MAKLLLVEDDPDMCDAFAAVLRLLGHDTRVACNGREGISRLLESRPDVIVSDIEMPVQSGPEMASEVLHRDAGLERIPILLTSGAADLARIAEQLGTPYFLAKPFTVEKLQRVLDHVLAERQAPRPVHPTSGAP